MTAAYHLGFILPHCQAQCLVPLLSPCVLQGESPGRPEDPRQRARLTRTQVRELFHSEFSRDAHNQEQVGLWAQWDGLWVAGSSFLFLGPELPRGLDTGSF
jgi:hypothetical protein